MNLLVLQGGPSPEHDVSLLTGDKMAAGLRKAGHGVRVVTVGHDRTWRENDHERTPHDLLEEIDVVVLATHGLWGEDGTIQGFLEALEVPYTGSDILASALAMDKWRSKALFHTTAIPTPDALLVYRSEDLTAPGVEAPFLDRMRSSVEHKAVVKPAAGGSSVGVAIVHRFEDIPNAIENALQHDDAVLVEEYIAGREITCGVLEGSDGVLQALPVTEITPAEEYPFYDYDAKYRKGGSEHICPAEIPEAVATTIQEYAMDAFEALGCRDYARVDGMMRMHKPDDEAEEEWEVFVLEVNTLPGMTPTSLFPEAAAVADMAFPDLMDHLVELAKHRFDDQ